MLSTNKVFPFIFVFLHLLLVPAVSGFKPLTLGSMAVVLPADQLSLANIQSLFIIYKYIFLAGLFCLFNIVAVSHPVSFPVSWVTCRQHSTPDPDSGASH
jgi:hypothetical protein